MIAVSRAGTAEVTWNDQGDACMISINGHQVHMPDADLRDLYACLDFLYGKPSRDRPAG